MNKLCVSINDLPGGVMAKCEQDLSDLVDEYAERMQHDVDAAALDRVAGTLVKFGYVKVVRCRDCECYANDDMGDWCELHDFAERGSMADGYCAWGVLRGDAQERGEGEQC